MKLISRLLTLVFLSGSVLTPTAQAWEKTIFISRHGETLANLDHVLIGQKLDPRVVLSEKGKTQAESLAALLQDSGIQRIYVSRLVRSHQTAEPLSEKLGLTPFVRSALDEINFGRLEGISQDSRESQEALKRTDRDCEYRFGEGESRRDLDRRLGNFLEEVSRPETPRTVLIVGHFGTVRELLALFLGLACPEAGKIFPANSDVFRLVVEDGNVRKLELSSDRKPFKEGKAADLMKSERPAFLKPLEKPAGAPPAVAGKAQAPPIH